MWRNSPAGAAADAGAGPDLGIASCCTVGGGLTDEVLHNGGHVTLIRTNTIQLLEQRPAVVPKQVSVQNKR